MTEHTDEETQRMLGELTEREQLEARAKELGVKFRGNTGNDTIRERIAEAEAAMEQPAQEPPEPDAVLDTDAVVTETTAAERRDLAPGPLTVTNAGNNVRVINTIRLKPGESHSLSDDELGNERLMTKVRRAIEIGVLVAE